MTHHVTSPVIHQVPLNSELYVHRSGRTARAKREGLSLILIGPQEMMSYKNICKSLRRGCHAYSSHILVCDYVIMQRGSLRFQWIRSTCKPFVAESVLLGDWRLPFTVETRYVHKVLSFRTSLILRTRSAEIFLCRRREIRTGYSPQPRPWN